MKKKKKKKIYVKGKNTKQKCRYEYLILISNT